MGRATANFVLDMPLGALGRGQKVKYHSFQSQSHIQRLLNQTLCLFSQMKDTKHIRRDFLFCPLGHARGVGLWGAGGGGGGARGQKNDFNDVAYQIDGDDEQNRMQVKFSSYGETGDLRVRSKGQISLNFG